VAEPDPKSDEWINEFKKLNSGSPSASNPDPAPAAPGDPASPSKGSERRRHGRFEVDDASAQLYKEGLLSFIGVGKGNLARAAIDLSEGGAQFLVHERLSPGTKVKVKIGVDKFNDTIEASGVVRWCFQSAKKKEDFYVGVQFSDMEGVQSRKLAAMREWFTSPQYKAVRQTRQRTKEKPGGVVFPK